MPDEMDRAQELAEQHRTRALLGQVNRATDLKAGGSASCIDCGANIPKKRRTAVPSTRRCIECQTEVERSNGR